MGAPPKIAILFETLPDFQIVKRHLGRLAEWNVPYAMTMASALKSADRLGRWIEAREKEGVEVFIVAAGGGASLAGAVAALTHRPVIGVPLDTTPLRGQDSLCAMTGMPVGLPVAVVGINHVENAFYGALRVLALGHPRFAELLEQLRAEWPSKEREALENLSDQYPEFFPPPGEREALSEVNVLPTAESASQRETAEREAAPAEPAEPAERLAAEPEPVVLHASESPAAPAISHPRTAARRIVVDPLQPDVATIEAVMEALLDGGIVALPTDTVYGLAAVATNARAVERLFELKGRDPGKPIPLLIHSTRGLARLVREVPEAVRGLLDSHWPGALTVVFRKYPGSFVSVAPGDTIGLRMPDHNATLAVISMVARPLAVTSANRSGQPPALTADDVMAAFGEAIECVLDAGKTPGEKVSTVLSVAATPFRLLREGAVSYAELKAILGDHLADRE